MENKKIDLRKPYYEENNISETLTEIENEKQKNIGDYLKLGLNILQRILIRLETEKENYFKLILNTADGLIMLLP